MNIETMLYRVSLCALCFGVLVIFGLVLFDLLFLRTSPASPYEVASVQQLCRTFALPVDDDFCLRSDQQYWYTLEAALIRHFPYEQTSFSEIMKNIEVSHRDFSAEPRKFPTHKAIAATFSGDVGANCPDSGITTDIYTCRIYFKADIRPITVTFDRGSDRIVHIGVGHTGT